MRHSILVLLVTLTFLGSLAIWAALRLAVAIRRGRTEPPEHTPPTSYMGVLSSLAPKGWRRVLLDLRLDSNRVHVHLFAACVLVVAYDSLSDSHLSLLILAACVVQAGVVEWGSWGDSKPRVVESENWVGLLLTDPRALTVHSIVRAKRLLRTPQEDTGNTGDSKPPLELGKNDEADDRSAQQARNRANAFATMHNAHHGKLPPSF